MKNRGFTLIELLAVIVVLGIIMLIAVTAVSGVITKSRLSSFNTSSEMLEKAASTYINASNTIVATGTTTTILYSDLKSGSYMNQIVDPISKNECTNSRVYVTNVNGTYTYEGAVACNNYMDIDAYNLVANSNFSSTTNWTGTNSTLSVTTNILSVTGNGTAHNPRISQAYAFVSNHVYFMRAEVKVPTGCTQFQIYGGGTATVYAVNISNPTTNAYVVYSGLSTMGATASSGLYISNFYADAATSNAKVMQIDGTNGVYVIDLTAIYGAGNEPTLAQMDKVMSNMGK